MCNGSADLELEDGLRQLLEPVSQVTFLQVDLCLLHLVAAQRQLYDRPGCCAHSDSATMQHSTISDKANTFVSPQQPAPMDCIFRLFAVRKLELALEPCDRLDRVTVVLQLVDHCTTDPNKINPIIWLRQEKATHSYQRRRFSSPFPHRTLGFRHVP